VRIVESAAISGTRHSSIVKGREANALSSNTSVGVLAPARRTAPRRWRPIGCAGSLSLTQSRSPSATSLQLVIFPAAGPCDRPQSPLLCRRNPQHVPVAGVDRGLRRRRENFSGRRVDCLASFFRHAGRNSVHGPTRPLARGHYPEQVQGAAAPRRSGPGCDPRTRTAPARTLASRLAAIGPSRRARPERSTDQPRGTQKPMLPNGLDAAIVTRESRCHPRIGRFRRADEYRPCGQSFASSDLFSPM
jgi:hypothetical protein